MRPVRRRAGLLFTSLALLAAGAAACSGNGGGGDDDDGSTPQPIDPAYCQIVWVTQDPPGQTERLDYYLVDAPVGSWETGDEAYYIGDPSGVTNVTGAWVDGYDLVLREWDQAAIATSGVFALTVGTGGDTLAAGSPVAFDDTTPQSYFLLGSANELTAEVGASGTGSFTGVWSTPGSPDVEEGSGTIAFAYLGSDLTLGVDIAFAQCYEAASAFAPRSRAETLRSAGDRAGLLLR